MKNREELRIIGKQMVRSACSVAANFRASCRARSQGEHYSNLCIVVEESDETLFWLEMIEETALINTQSLKLIKEEILSVLQVMSKTRKTLKT